MSKTLFNQNTFNDKNVTNSNNIDDIKIDTLKVTNATITNLTNSELQAATAGVATNASAISTNATNISSNTTAISTNATNISSNTTAISSNATAISNKEDAFVVSEFNPLKKDKTNTPYLLYVATDNSPTFGSNDVVTSGGLYQYLLDNYNKKLTNGSELQLSIDDTGTGININDEISVILASQAGATEYGLINGAVLHSELSSKQDTLTAGDGIDIDGSNEISLDGTRTGNFIITGNFESEGTDYKLWNATRGGAGTSNGRVFVHTGSGTKASSILRLNYNDDFGGGTQIDSIVSIGTTPDSSYDLKVNGNTDIGGVLSIAGYSNVRTALDNATGGTTYTALVNGGLEINASNEIGIDLTNTNSDFEIPQRVVITTDTTDAHLIVQPSSNTGQDAIIKMIGKRNTTTSERQAQLHFQNYDNDDGSTAYLGEIAGVVRNATTNIGGLAFYNFTDGSTSTRTAAMTMNASGRFHFGTTFQNNYKLQVTGDTYFTGNSIIDGTLQIGGITNVRTAIEGKQDPISALSGGGLAVSNNEISVDFSNTTADIDIPQRVVIEDDTTAQLIVKSATSGNDAAITIRGERNTTSNRQAQLRFENTLSGTANDLAEITGVVTNAGSNIGGLSIYNFADGSTRTEAMMMNENGRFHFGTTFQNDYKLQVTGNCNFTGDTNVGGSLYRVPQQVFYNFNIASMTGSSSAQGPSRFGDGGRFNSLASTRTTGTSFTSHSNGTFTFSANGYYRIKVSANNQNITYNDRTAFGVYLNINGTEYWQNRNYNFFGWNYTRNTTDGAHGNIVFEDCIYIADTQTLEVKTKMDSNNRSWDDSLSLTEMNCYCNLQIERIAETDIS